MRSSSGGASGRRYLGVQLQELSPSGLVVKSVVEDGLSGLTRINTL